jgi:hypothetical protein
VLSRLDRVPATAALRSDFIYNNVMYEVAGEVVAAASGMPWERFIASRIMGPLGMRESYPTLATMRAAVSVNVSVPHAEIDGAIRTIEDALVDASPASGAGWSTASDAGKWMAFMLAGGKVGGKRLVSEARFNELIAPQVAVRRAQWTYPTTAALTKPRMTAYGLGWYLQDYRGQFVAMHSGSKPGRTAIAGMFPDARLAVYAFGNLDHAEFRHALMWQVLDLYTGAPARDWNGEALKLYGDMAKARLKEQADEDAKRILETRPSHESSAYTGTYRNPTWGDITVAIEGAALALHFGPSPNNAGLLEHWHYDTFRARLGPGGMYGWDKYSFVTDSDGSIGAITNDGMSFVRVKPANSAATR